MATLKIMNLYGTEVEVPVVFLRKSNGMPSKGWLICVIHPATVCLSDVLHSWYVCMWVYMYTYTCRIQTYAHAHMHAQTTVIRISSLF